MELKDLLQLDAGSAIDWIIDNWDEYELKRKQPHPEHAEGSSLGDLVAEINENVEVVMLCGPTDQMDADEPRATMTIAGPKRLISPLADKFC